MKKLKRPKCARPTCSAIPAVAEIAKQESIRFKINVIVDKLQGSTDPCSRFVRAGDPSPYHSLNEGPESLKAFVGEPPPEPAMSAWEDEQRANRRIIRRPDK